MAFLNNDISVNNIISSGSFISGNVKINGSIRLEGDLEGDFEATGDVVIGENARIKGNISATSITVGGIVCGNIVAPESVHLLSTSAVIGDIQTHSFQADANVIFHGHCISLKDAQAYGDASLRWQNTQAIISKVVKVQQ